MNKKLIITEKPSVARDFARVLGVTGNRNGYIENSNYVISWCYGHLVEMVYPEEYDSRYASWKLEDLPFLPQKYKYGVIKSAKEQYEVVHSLLFREDIDTVYWAGDSGKEGQTIEENIRNYGGVRSGMTELRVWIDSQTDDEIRRGINEAKPMSDYERLGRSGIMRTIEDYSLGINFSRALSVKYGRMINDAAATSSYTAIAIGRVMTCVLGMVVDREREIRNFVETPFYRITGAFLDAHLNAEWKSVEGSKYQNSPKLYKENGFKKELDAQNLINELSGKNGRLLKIESGTAKKKAPLLFNLAELQSECSKIFKISPSQALSIAQDLYERKLTTYPRTDARVLTKAVAKEITKNLNGLIRYDEVSSFASAIINDKKYVGLEKTTYVDDSKVTDHYAIIPTGQTNGIDKLDALHKAVYNLIARRFLSIFYPPAEYATLKLEIQVDDEHFFTQAKVLKNPGYMEVSGVATPKESDGNDDDNAGLSKEELLKLAETWKVGDDVGIGDYSIKEGKTSPPKRYTSGNLILAMENAGNLIEDEELREQIKNTGIGTSATRGDILEKLVRIKYLNQNPKTQIITPEKLGEMIYEVVNMSIPSLLNPEMTASWEKGLEGIINGTVDDVVYREKLEAYIRRETEKMIESDLSREIAYRINPFTGKESKGLATRKNLDLVCPVCGGNLTTTPFGYGCDNYYNEDNPCKFSLGKVAGVDISEEDFKDLITKGRTGVISGFVSKSKKPFKACLVLKTNEEGKTDIGFDFEGVGPDYLEEVTCPDCGKRLKIMQSGFGCEGYDQTNPDSCRFYIGKIAQKQLSQAQVVELLKEGKTKTIRGFKSKTGKKFDACLVLKKNDQGKTEVGFDFKEVEAKVIKDAVCPLCGGEIIKTSFGYGCRNYSRDNPEDSCRFNIGTIAGVKLNEGQLRELLKNGITSPIDGFKSKSGKPFCARITLDKDESGKVVGTKFVFEDQTVELQGLECPKCKAAIVKGHTGYRCKNYTREEGGCKFFVGNICGVLINEEQLGKLLQNKKTDVITGFVSKSGKQFDTALVLDEKGDVNFEFAVKNNIGGTDNGNN